MEKSFNNSLFNNQKEFNYNLINFHRFGKILKFNKYYFIIQFIFFNLFFVFFIFIYIEKINYFFINKFSTFLIMQK